MTYQKMDPIRKKNWVAALRSGLYPQASDSLGTKGKGFCCLGVLAEIDECFEDVSEDFVLADRVVFEYTPAESRYTTDLPGSVVDRKAQAALICKNDQKKETFSEIADWIEENL